MPARICSSRSRFPANSKSGIGRSRGCVNASPASSLARQQIKSFLLVHGIAQPVGLNCWSDKGIDGLRSLKLDEQLRFCLDVLIEEEQHAYKQVEKVTLELKKLATEERFRERIRCLRSVPGVGLLTAMTFATELIAPERFDEAGEVARMLGLAPRVRQSGDRRREGSLMKEGNDRAAHDPGRGGLALGITRRARPRGRSPAAQKHGRCQEGDRWRGAETRHHPLALGDAARNLPHLEPCGMNRLTNALHRHAITDHNGVGKE